MEEPPRFLHSLPVYREKVEVKGSMMKQAVMTAPGKISFADVPTPAVKSDEVLVRIIRIGVCGSDIHVFHGKHPYTSYPVVQGHEVSGVLEKVGAEVTEYKKWGYPYHVPKRRNRQLQSTERTFRQGAAQAA